MKYFYSTVLFLIASLGSTSAQVKVQLEWIQVNSKTLVKLINQSQSTGDKLRQKVQELIKSEQAALIDTAIYTVKKSEEISTQSGQNLIYPTEYDPPGIPPFPKTNKPRTNPKDFKVMIPTSTAFEQKNVGQINRISVQPSKKSTGYWELYLSTEKCKLISLDTLQPYRHENGHSDFTLPRFCVSNNKHHLTLKNNTYQLIYTTQETLADGKVNKENSFICFVRLASSQK